MSLNAYTDEFDPVASSCALEITSLPEPILDLVAAHLSSTGSRDNFRACCRAFAAAADRSLVHTLDLYERCGWCGRRSSSGGGSGGQRDVVDQHPHRPGHLPEAALDAPARYPRAQSLVIPGGWRHRELDALLTAAASTPGAWRSLSSVSMHANALTPAAAAALARHAPRLQHMSITLDLPFQRTSRQAWRVSSLVRELPHLSSFSTEVDLRPEALQALSALTGLDALALAGRCSKGHPGASLAALAMLTRLTALRLHWQAGRTLADVTPLRMLTGLQRLQLWLGAGPELPPCASRPLHGLLPALAGLTHLTQLQLLRGLHVPADLRELHHLGALRQLEVLGLHDSVLGDTELAALAPCTALRCLRVDALRLPSRASAAAGVADAMTAAVLLGRLEHLEVNMLSGGVGWGRRCSSPRIGGRGGSTGALAELCTGLTHFGPLESTLGAAGQGCVVDLGMLAGHPRLVSLGLLLGALGSTLTIRSGSAAQHSRRGALAAAAAAVSRAVLGSIPARGADEGGGSSGGAPEGVAVGELLVLLRGLPALRNLQLWGHAGGLSGRTLASLRRSAAPRSGHACGAGCKSCDGEALVHSTGSHSGLESCNWGGSVSSSRSSSSVAASLGSISIPGSPSYPSTAATSPVPVSATSAAVALSDLSSTMGSLLGSRSGGTGLNQSHRGSIMGTPLSIARTATALVMSAGGLLTSRSAAGDTGQSREQQQQQQHVQLNEQGDSLRQRHPSTRVLNCAGCYAAGGSCFGCASAACDMCRSSVDFDFVRRLLLALPALCSVQLHRCRHLPRCGCDLAARLCSRLSNAEVCVLRA